MHTFSNGITVGSPLYYHLLWLFKHSEAIERLTKEQVESAIRVYWKSKLDMGTPSDLDYYRCTICGKDQTNLTDVRMNQNRMAMACYCDSGCDFHGDLFVSAGRKYPKKVLEYLKEKVDTVAIG